MNISEILANLLREKNLKQADLSRLTGIPTSLISNYIKGIKSPTLTNSIKLAEALGVSVDELAGIDTKKSTPAEAGADEPIPIGIFAEKNGEDYVKDTLLALGFIGDGQALTKSQIRIASYALEILATALASDFQEEEDVG